MLLDTATLRTAVAPAGAGCAHCQELHATGWESVTGPLGAPLLEPVGTLRDPAVSDQQKTAERAAAVRTPAQMKVITTSQQHFDELAQASEPDLPAVVEANQAFHFAVYAAAGLPDLVDVIGSLWLKVGPVINLDLRENPERLATGQAAELHAACAKAIARGDGKAARAAIAADISGAADFILSQGRLPDC